MELIDYIIHSVLALLALILIGIVIDFPEYLRKKRKANCESGRHKFTEWEAKEEIHNGNELWIRNCKHCGLEQRTVSKLIPYTPDYAYCFDCEMMMPTIFRHGNLFCKNCNMVHSNNINSLFK